MRVRHVLTVATAAILCLFISTTSWAKLVISGNNDQFLPAESLPALAITLSHGGDIIHLKLAMTGDDHVVLLRDTILDDITNVASVFPDKARTDGHFHVMDLTLAELQQLSLRTAEPIQSFSSAATPPFPGIAIATLEEALGVIKTMEFNRGSSIGIVAEIKKSWQYLHEQKDISRTVINVFQQYGYSSQTSNLILASYDPEELKRIHDSLMPAAGIDLKLLQLTEDNTGHQTRRFELGRWQPYSYDWIFTKFGIKAVSGYADMIAIKPEFLLGPNGDLLRQDYVEDIHILGMQIIVNPFDPLAESYLLETSSVESLAETLLFTAGADGLITHFDQEIKDFLERRKNQDPSQRKTTIELLLENVKKQQNN